MERFIFGRCAGLHARTLSEHTPRAKQGIRRTTEIKAIGATTARIEKYVYATHSQVMFLEIATVSLVVF
jgi:hypothetical protein